MVEESKAKEEDKKKRGKAIWNKMTLEERQKANDNMIEIIKWSSKETDNIITKLKAEGKYISGVLDGDSQYPELVEHRREYKKRLYDLCASVFGEENMGEWNI